MKTLITPQKVAELAYRAPDFINPAAIAEATIVAAQQKYLKPVFGALYDRLCEGDHPDFTDEYIVPALALYVRVAMIGSSAPAARTLLAEAKPLIRRGVQHVETNLALFPEYDPRDNILNRCSIAGGIVLNK